MATASSENPSSEVSPEVLVPPRHIAESEGRQLQAVLDEALREYIERKEKGYPRQQVMAAFEDSLREFDLLYRELAK
jgi:hypothetical protein